MYEQIDYLARMSSRLRAIHPLWRVDHFVLHLQKAQSLSFHQLKLNQSSNDRI